MQRAIRQSDEGIVPTKSANKTGEPAAESMEGRPTTKGKAKQGPMSRTQGRNHDMKETLKRLREAVRRDKEAKLTALYHHVYNVEHLRSVFNELNRKAAAGVDGQTWAQYAQDLESNLQGLAARLRRGAYRAAPVRRVYVPKADGRQRSLGVTTLEDKVVQGVVARLLSTIWEEEFLGFSYGFRPGRSAHQALDALAVGLETRSVRWVLDADIRGFYDTLSHEWLETFVEHRIGDKRIVKLIHQWLKAGVLEQGEWRWSEKGTPQGGLISPLLANIYMHYVFDQWVNQWRKRKAQGDVIVVRYADDFVLGFAKYGEAQAFQRELSARLAKFNLALHAEKTRLIEFGRYAETNRAERGLGKPETFDFLGFTHICTWNRKGNYTVLRRTMRKRLNAKVKAVKSELRKRMHDPIAEQGKWLRGVVQGHYQYYGVPMNGWSLDTFRKRVLWVWKQTLSRRSQTGYITNTFAN